MGLGEWISKKKQESRERSVWEKEAKAEAMAEFKQQYRKSLASSMKTEAMNKAKREAKARARNTFAGGGSLMGRLEGARSSMAKGLSSYSGTVGQIPIVQDIYGTPASKPRRRKRKPAQKKPRKKRKTYARQSDPFSLF